MPRKWLANPPESPRRCWKSHRLCHDPGTSWAKGIHTGKLTSPFSTGNTSSNSGFSIVMLVSGGYVYMNSSENHWLKSAKHNGGDGWDNSHYPNLLQKIAVGFIFQNPGGPVMLFSMWLLWWEPWKGAICFGGVKWSMMPWWQNQPLKLGFGITGKKWTTNCFIYLTHTIHGAGISTHILVGKYTKHGSHGCWMFTFQNDETPNKN